MSHNGFDFIRDLIRPLTKFLTKIKFKINKEGLELDDMYYQDKDFQRIQRIQRMKNYKTKIKSNFDIFEKLVESEYQYDISSKTKNEVITEEQKQPGIGYHSVSVSNSR